MILGELTGSELAHRLSQGLRFRTGPFSLCLQSDYAGIGQQLRLLYPLAPLIEDHDRQLTDFAIQLQRPRNLRRWLRPQIIMRTDAETPFEPFQLDHALPLFEWSYNWCIATQAQQYLMLHSAVVEKDGLALILPALPGSGKSTLSAALMLRGWRLLTDEFGLLRPGDEASAFHPLPRPIPLKNESIEVIRNFSGAATLGPTYPKTRKGDVAHLMPTHDSQSRWHETAPAGWFLFPQYQAGSATQLDPLARGWTFMKISGNSFNYKLQGAQGFRAISRMVNNCPSYALHYSDLDDAVSRIDSLHSKVIQEHKHTPRQGSCSLKTRLKSH